MFSLGLEFSLRKLVAGRRRPPGSRPHPVQRDDLARLRRRARASAGPRSRASSPARSSRSRARPSSPRRSTSRASAGALRELVVGVLIVEDLIAILLMAVLTAIAAGNGLSAGDAGADRRAGWSASSSGLVAVGLLIVPRADARGRAARTGRRPRSSPASASASGSRCSRSRSATRWRSARSSPARWSPSRARSEQIEHLVAAGARRVRRGVLRLGRHADRSGAGRATLGARSLVLTVVVIVGKIVSVSLGAFLTGNGTRTSVAAGHEPGADRRVLVHHRRPGLRWARSGEFLYPVAVAVSAITTLTTPWLIRAPGRWPRCVDRKLPSRCRRSRRSTAAGSTACARRDSASRASSGRRGCCSSTRSCSRRCWSSRPR